MNSKIHCCIPAEEISPYAQRIYVPHHSLSRGYLLAAYHSDSGFDCDSVVILHRSRSERGRFCYIVTSDASFVHSPFGAYMLLERFGNNPCVKMARLSAYHGSKRFGISVKQVGWASLHLSHIRA